MTATNSQRLDPRLIGCRVGNRALLATVVVAAAGTLALALAAGTAGAQTGVVIAAPMLLSAPEDYSSDSTPRWTFTGDAGATFNCTLSQPFEGAWDGGGSGEDPEPPPVIVDSRRCDSGSYTFDLGAYPDHGYTFSVSQTDASGNTSEPATDWFRLDRVAITPIIRTSPDDVTNDPTPMWTFYSYGESGTHFHCTLTRAGATNAVYDGGCSSETFTFDLNPYPDDTYTLSVTQTDLAGNTSDAVTDSFVLDRTIPNAAPIASFVWSCTDLTCRSDASASTDGDGQIVSYRWDFGDGMFLIESGSFTEAWHGYSAPGSYTVTLTVTDNADATATDSQTITVGNPPPAPNAPPTAAFGVSCAGLSCSADAGDAADPDGTITRYAWEFGDGATATGKNAQHTYLTAASYTIKLSVTDDDRATATATKTIALIRLTAKGYKTKGVQTVDLSWNAPGTARYAVYRDDLNLALATVSGGAYTDSLNTKGPGSFRYRVCEQAASICSNTATVSF